MSETQDQINEGDLPCPPAFQRFRKIDDFSQRPKFLLNSLRLNWGPV